MDYIKHKILVDSIRPSCPECTVPYKFETCIDSIIDLVESEKITDFKVNWVVLFQLVPSRNVKIPKARLAVLWDLIDRKGLHNKLALQLFEYLAKIQRQIPMDVLTKFCDIDIYGPDVDVNYIQVYLRCLHELLTIVFDGSYRSYIVRKCVEKIVLCTETVHVHEIDPAILVLVIDTIKGLIASHEYTSDFFKTLGVKFSKFCMATSESILCNDFETMEQVLLYVRTIITITNFFKENGGVEEFQLSNNEPFRKVVSNYALYARTVAKSHEVFCSFDHMGLLDLWNACLGAFLVLLPESYIAPVIMKNVYCTWSQSLKSTVYKILSRDRSLHWKSQTTQLPDPLWALNFVRTSTKKHKATTLEKLKTTLMSILSLIVRWWHPDDISKAIAMLNDKEFNRELFRYYMIEASSKPSTVCRTLTCVSSDISHAALQQFKIIARLMDSVEVIDRDLNVCEVLFFQYCSRILQNMEASKVLQAAVFACMHRFQARYTKVEDKAPHEVIEHLRERYLKVLEVLDDDSVDLELVELVTKT